MPNPEEPLSPTAERVLEILKQYTVFSWPVLRAQCDRASVAPETLSPAQLTALIPLLAAGVARFTSPVKGDEVKRELEKLARG